MIVYGKAEKKFTVEKNSRTSEDFYINVNLLNILPYASAGILALLLLAKRPDLSFGFYGYRFIFFKYNLNLII